MIGDWFWDVATSSVMLAIIAALAVVAFLVAHVPAIVQRFVPQLAAYAKAALLVEVLASALLMFLIGFRVADERAELKQVKNELAWKDKQLSDQEATARDAEALKQQAEQAAAEAKGQLDEFRKNYDDKPEAGCSFTPDDLDRLRSLRPPSR